MCHAPGDKQSRHQQGLRKRISVSEKPNAHAL